MPLVHAADLVDHTRRIGYHVPAFELVNLDHIVPILETAERNASSVIQIFSADAGRSSVPVLAAAVARTSTVPVVIEARTAPHHEKVIESYRDHPDHTAFANQLFRPIAGDRISIDFAEVSSLPEAKAAGRLP